MILRQSAYALFVVALMALTCRRPPAAPAPEEAILRRQVEGLRQLVGAAEGGRLVAFEQLLVVVDDTLVQDVLASAMPWEQIVAERYRVQVAGAEVQFEDGFALVRLDGRVSLAADPEARVFADVRVYGGLDVVELDRASGVLTGKIALIGFDVSRAEVLGSSLVDESLAAEFGRQRLESLSALASPLKIPVRFERQVRIPGVGPEGPVSIDAAAIPMTVSVADVKAFRGRLWVSLRASAREGPPGEGVAD
jgi:hypothetical protein